MRVDALGSNLPGGEIFGCPIETSAQGTISFGAFPAVYGGRELTGIRLRFEDGVVVDASADTNEAIMFFLRPISSFFCLRIESLDSIPSSLATSLVAYPTP